MIVGVLTVDVALLEALTLKDKRRIMLGFRDRLRNQFNVSVAEVEFGDSPRRCRLGIALVNTGSRAAHAQMDKIVEMIRRTGGLTLLEYHRELL